MQNGWASILNRCDQDMYNTRNMDVILIRPLHSFGRSIFRGQRIIVSLGILAVAASLEDAGYKVKIIDQQLEPQWKELLLAELKKSPVCVGVTCMTGPQIRFAIEVSRIVKQNSSIPVVWGGTHPTLLPEQTLENEYIDIVVQGEGEETFPELVNALAERSPLDSIKGIWYKNKGQIRTNPPRPLIDLNKQPPLAYHLINVKDYLEPRLGDLFLRTFTSRGCSYHCTFCYNTKLYHGKWRGLTAEETIRRIKSLKNTYDIQGIIFCDDNFFGSISRAREIIEGLIRERLNLILFKIDIRVDILFSLDDDFLSMLKRSGCNNVAIGLESGSERILALLKKKNITVSKILAVNRRLRNFGIIPSYTFMIGYPTETLEELRQTVSLMFKLEEEYPEIIRKLHIYTPLPGTELFELAVQHGFEFPESLEDWIPFSYRMVNLPWVSRDRKKLLEMLYFCFIVLDKHAFHSQTTDIHPFFRLLGRLYYPLALWRVKRFFYKFPFEIKLAEWIGLYPKQA